MTSPDTTADTATDPPQPVRPPRWPKVLLILFIMLGGIAAVTLDAMKEGRYLQKRVQDTYSSLSVSAEQCVQDLQWQLRDPRIRTNAVRYVLDDAVRGGYNAGAPEDTTSNTLDSAALLASLQEVHPAREAIGQKIVPVLDQLVGCRKAYAARSADLEWAIGQFETWRGSLSGRATNFIAGVFGYGLPGEDLRFFVPGLNENVFDEDALRLMDQTVNRQLIRAYAITPDPGRTPLPQEQSG